MSDMGPVRFNMFQVLSQVRTLLATGGDLPITTSSGAPAQTAASIRNWAAASGMVLPQMEGDQATRLLKDALKWPDDIKDMLADLAGEEMPEALPKDLKKSLKGLLQALPQDGSIGLETLADKLEKQTQGGMERLMKLVQGGALSQGKGGAQVAELASSLGQLAEQVRTSPQQAAKLLILMALPLCPLPPPLELDVSWEDGGEGDDGGDEEIAMVLYLQTKTLGRFKLALEQLKPLQITVGVSHEGRAKPVLPALEEALNEHLAGEGLPAAIMDFTEVASPSAEGTAPMEAGHFKGATRQANRQEVQMQKGSRVSVLVLSCAYFLARTLFDLDAQNNPLARK